MNIIICGAGRVGFSISKQLSAQGHSITVIDQSSEFIQKINESNERFKKIADYRETKLDIMFKCECRKNLEQPDEINCKTRNWFQKIWDKISINAGFLSIK